MLETFHWEQTFLHLASKSSIWTKNVYEIHPYPPDFCKDPYTQEVTKVPMSRPLSAPFSLLAASLTCTRPRLIPMPLMFRWLLNNEILQHRQWPGPELFQKFMNHVGKRVQE
mgnify:CR=1 FL=1